MTTATSPTFSRSTTTPAGRPPTFAPGSVGQAMPPFLSSHPRISTPHNPPPNAKSPSPNYFGLQDGGSFLPDAPTRTNWSPPSSAVRSTAAASPSVVPLDQNPDFEAFRRQSEGKAFNLGAMGNSFQMTAPPPPNWAKVGRSASRPEQPREAAQQQRQSQTLDPSTADTGRSPKRVLSPGSAMITEQERRASPASFLSEPERRTGINATLDSQPKFALPFDNAQSSFTQNRAETLPAKPTNPSPTTDTEQTLMVTAQHVVNLVESKHEQVLLLDLRVSTQYAKSHISGALNLCIPTTLLKRPSFNVHKLADTFKDPAQRQRFEKWRNSSYIIVHDASSSLLKDAQICVNTIKKFRSEGYEGNLYILKGGFQGFSSRFSSYIEEGPDSSGDTGVEDGPDVAPVIGGCPMPGLDQPANPFFGNIRQNMDLIGGVGQMPLTQPSKAMQGMEKEYPEWLSKAASKNDNGKRVAGKFEAIEKREKKRMEEALSGKVQFGTPRKANPNSNTVETNKVQIAGIEKGTKNRYNNIWPFEHSRVKLQGIPHHGCDFINASFVKTGWSHKKYISTQAPIPATFNDFWNMVWQQDVRVVVMLTAEKEGAQVKAHNYWEKKAYGPLQLEYLSEKRASIEPNRIHRHRHNYSKTRDNRPSGPRRSSTSGPVPLAPIDPKESKDEPYVIVRRFTLSHSKQPFEPMREITQLQYSSWPDFGAPAHPAHLLGLVEQTNAVARSVNRTSSREPEPEGKRPVLVHCSAGCGRTGTFCTVDSVIDMLKRQKMSRAEGETVGRDPTPMDIDSKSPPPPSTQKTKSGHTSSTPRASTSSGFGGGGGFFEQANSNPYGDATTTNTGSSPMREEGIDGKWLRRDDQDLVEKTVEDFRHQRLSMVQSLRQYVLCYESVMEWLVDEATKKDSPS